MVRPPAGAGESSIRPVAAAIARRLRRDWRALAPRPIESLDAGADVKRINVFGGFFCNFAPAREAALAA
jgi:hypothetical protein